MFFTLFQDFHHIKMSRFSSSIPMSRISSLFRLPSFTVAAFLLVLLFVPPFAWPPAGGEAFGQNMASPSSGEVRAVHNSQGANDFDVRARRFSSKKPGGNTGAINEIDLHLASIDSLIKSGEELKSSRGWPEPQDSEETAMVSAIRSSIESAVTDLNRLKADFQYLQKDFVSIKAKNELIRAQNSIAQSSQQNLTKIREQNYRDLSYEISLLENTIGSKKEEKAINQKEVSQAVDQQNALLDRLAVACCRND